MPIYDLTDMTFNPETDFFTVAEKRREIVNKEVSTTEPVIVTYYLTRLNKKSKSTSEVNYDLSIQWVGQLLGKV